MIVSFQKEEERPAVSAPHLIADWVGGRFLTPRFLTRSDCRYWWWSQFLSRFYLIRIVRHRLNY